MNENEIQDRCNRALMLHRRITANIQAAQESLFQVCRDLKRIRDGRLFEELGYTVFEDYCTKEFELSYKQACKYIAVAERYPDGISPGRLGISKLYLISTLSDEERSELEENIDIEQASKSELEKEIKELKERNKALEEEKQVTFADLEKANAEIEQAKAAKEKAEAAEKKIEKLKKEKDKLSQKLKDLETKKQETVAIENTTEIERLKKELAEAEKKLSEATKPETVTQTVEIHDDIDEFRAHFTTVVDSISRLLAFVAAHKDSKNAAFFKGKLIVLADKISKGESA